MNRAMEALGGDVVKRYRVYERRLGSGSSRSNSGDGAGLARGLPAPVSAVLSSV
jgi:hypothetical protein